MNQTEPQSPDQSAVVARAIIYTDGSCREGNPGYIGWGFHGYMHPLEEIDKAISVDNFTTTSTGYEGPKRNESSKLVKPLKYFDGFGSDDRLATNNLAELLAVKNALKLVESINAQGEYRIEQLTIMADSEYCVKGLNEWVPNWSVNGWRKQDGEPVSNAESWKLVLELKTALVQSGVKILLRWIQGHNDHPGNDRADILAGIGANHSAAQQTVSEIKISDVAKYWKHEPQTHPFVSYGRLYFNSKPVHNRPGEYCLATSSSGKFTLGKREADTGLAVLKLAQPEQTIEDVKQRQYRMCFGYGVLMEMLLERVYSKNVYRYLSEYGEHALIPGRASSLCFMDRKPVTVELNARNLSVRALESFSFLDEVLDHYATPESDLFKTLDIWTHDITEHFYSVTIKAVKKQELPVHELHKHLLPGTQQVKMTVADPKDPEHAYPLSISLSTDTPGRNALKRLESHEPKILLITWRETEQCRRYAVVIEATSGKGVWSNFYANQIFRQPAKKASPS